MTFLQLLQKLEEQFGYHQLPLNPSATGIQNVFEGSPLHHDWMMNLVRSIYVANHCRKIDDPIRNTSTLEALASQRMAALRSSSTDVALRSLVDEIGEAIYLFFAENGSLAHAHMARTTDAGPGAEIIPFSLRKRRRSLA